MLMDSREIVTDYFRWRQLQGKNQFVLFDFEAELEPFDLRIESTHAESNERWAVLLFHIVA